MNTAKMIKDNLSGFVGHAALYELSTPIAYHVGYDDDDNEIIKYTSFVVVVTGRPFGMGIETYIFPSDSTGRIIDWGELPSSKRGTSPHAEVLNNAGYELIAGGYYHSYNHDCIPE